MKSNNHYVCSFCGKTPSDSQKMIVSQGLGLTKDVCICSDCVSMMYAIVSQEQEKAHNNVTNLKKPREIKAWLDSYIISQDNAKKSIATILYEHQKQVQYNSNLDVEQEMLDRTNILCIGVTGSGKCLPTDTPILTPSGFVQLKDIRVGSIVYDCMGQPSTVIAEYPQDELKQEWLITFTDNTSIKCCEDHLWMFKTRYHNGFKSDKWYVDSIKNMNQRLQVQSKKSCVYNIAIPINKPIQFDKKNLEIPPYLLGLLLGNGNFDKDITFVNSENDLIEKIKCLTIDNNLGEFVTDQEDSSQHIYRDTNSSKLKDYIKNTFGCCLAKDKFIPEEYKYSSIEDRLELVRGLIDTNGKINKKGYISFSTNSKQLVEDFKFLIYSLGYRVKLCANNYMYIWTNDDLLFTSKKHKEKFNQRKIFNKKYQYDILKIKSIQKLDTKAEMKCITVDSPTHTYICSKDFIVTHNTATFKALAKLLDRPLILESTTSITVSGIVGREITDILAHAIKDCNNDISQAEKSIILIDEFDKLARSLQTTSGRDVAGTALQQEFLKLLEGDKIQVQLGNKHSPLMDNTVEIDTSNILFVLSGAFVGLDEVVKNRISKKQIGFGHEEKKYTTDELLSQVTTEDLINYGLIPELIGRVPQVVIYNQLVEEDLVKILTLPKNAIVKQYQELFKMDHVDLHFQESALKLIAKLAISKKTNARGLKNIVSTALAKIEYDIPDRKDIKSVIITDELIEDKQLI